MCALECMPSRKHIHRLTPSTPVYPYYRSLSAAQLGWNQWLKQNDCTHGRLPDRRSLCCEMTAVDVAEAVPRTSLPGFQLVTSEVYRWFPDCDVTYCRRKNIQWLATKTWRSERKEESEKKLLTLRSAESRLCWHKPFDKQRKMIESVPSFQGYLVCAHDTTSSEKTRNTNCSDFTSKLF